MKKKRFAIEQITAILKQAELGAPVADLCRKVRAIVLSMEEGLRGYGAIGGAGA